MEDAQKNLDECISNFTRKRQREEYIPVYGKDEFGEQYEKDPEEIAKARNDLEDAMDYFERFKERRYNPFVTAVVERLKANRFLHNISTNPTKLINFLH